MFPLFPLVIMVCWCYGTEIRDRRPSMPRSRWGGRACPFMRCSNGWMLKCSLISIHIGRQGVASPSNSSGDVPPSSSFGEKRGRMHDPLRLLTWPPASWSTGGCLCCTGNGAPDQQGRNLRPVLPRIHTLKITQVLTMWAGMERGIGQGHGVLLEKLPEAERGPTTKGTKGSTPADAQPLWSKTPRGRRRDTSTKRDLAEERGAHQRALAATAALEERIERLSQSITRGQPDACAHSWNCDCQRRRSRG